MIFFLSCQKYQIYDRLKIELSNNDYAIVAYYVSNEIFNIETTFSCSSIVQHETKKGIRNYVEIRITNYEILSELKNAIDPIIYFEINNKVHFATRMQSFVIPNISDYFFPSNEYRQIVFRENDIILLRRYEIIEDSNN